MKVTLFAHVNEVQGMNHGAHTDQGALRKIRQKVSISGNN